VGMRRNARPRTGNLGMLHRSIGFRPTADGMRKKSMISDWGERLQGGLSLGTSCRSDPETDVPGAPHGGTSLYALDWTTCAHTHCMFFDVHPGLKG
jgi:hypothetical protein